MTGLKRHFLLQWRLVVLAVLVFTPILVLLGLGVYHVWASGLAFWLWWPLAGCFMLAAWLAWRWQRKRRLLTLDNSVPLYWTDRDLEAWKLIEARARQSDQVTAEQLTSFSFYVETGEAMAMELARFYHPRAGDPLGSLTIPEILAAVELAAHDLAEMVDENLPGGHLLTINDFRRVKQFADWYSTASKVSWVVSSIFAPFNTAVRYLAVQAGMSKPWQLLQDNVLVWFFTAFVHRLGTYLIDLNSGRLRIGAGRYLALQKGAPPATGNGAPAPAEDPAESVRTVTFAIVGQTKAGKSSVINGLLGEQKAITDVLPATSAVEAYQLQPVGVPTRLQLLDTVGYGNKGPRADQMRSTEEAVRQSDVIILVLHARNPARQGDLDFLRKLHTFFREHPDLKRPPILAVLTHIDLLSPAMEWAPPYDWQKPRTPKERSLHAAVLATQEQLGDFVTGIVPVCAVASKVYGVNEWLLPALMGLLDQAHAVAFLRCIKAERDRGKARKVFHQLLAAGKGLLQLFWQAQKASGPAARLQPILEHAEKDQAPV